jgi:hypothetical protein
MSPLIILGLVAFVPLVLILLLRVSSIYVFASVAAGGLLVQHLGDNAVLAVNAMLNGHNPELAVRLAMLLAPVLLTLFFMRGTLKGSRFIIELLPIIASLAMLFVLVIPQLPPHLKQQIMVTKYDKIIEQSKEVVIGVTVVLNLLVMWFFSRHQFAGDHHGR